jgi:hypothetical protein
VGERSSSLFGHFELNGPTGLLLKNDDPTLHAAGRENPPHDQWVGIGGERAWGQQNLFASIPPGRKKSIQKNDKSEQGLL